MPYKEWQALAWAARHQTARADFRAGLDRAQARASGPGQVQSVLPAYTRMTRQEAALVTVGSYPTTTNVGDLQRVAQLMSDYGVLRNPVIISRLIAP